MKRLFIGFCLLSLLIPISISAGEHAPGHKTQLAPKDFENTFPEAKETGQWETSQKRYAVKEKNNNGDPILRVVTIDKVAWVSLPKSQIKKGFAWLPGQIIPYHWMSQVGDKMEGLNPESGQRYELEIPKGIYLTFDNRGNAAGIMGEFTKIPDNAVILEKKPQGEGSL